jgi:hypothetical protein
MAQMADSEGPTRAAFDPLSEPLAGRYRIERELGRGGMAAVYLEHGPRREEVPLLGDLAEHGGDVTRSASPCRLVFTV